MAMDVKTSIEKKPYNPPELIEYGDVVDITRAGLNNGQDQDFGSLPEG